MSMLSTRETGLCRPIAHTEAARRQVASYENLGKYGENDCEYFQNCSSNF